MKRVKLIAILVASVSLFAQEQAGAISGQILGMDGQPAAGVRVAIVSPDANGKIESDILAGITITDETGHYRIEKVAPGRYGIAAGAVSAPTFYPGTATASGAYLLTVERGSTTTNLDFALVTPTVPMPGSQLTFDPALRAQAIVQLNQQLALPSQAIAGRVVVDGPIVSAFLPNLKLTFSRIIGTTPNVLVPPGGRAGISSYSIYSISTDVKLDGTFRLELKPQPYRISVGRADNKPLEGFIVKSITLGSTDLLKEELKVNGPVTGEIVITLLPVPVNRPIKL